jgi:fructose-bisphosphate aldolase class II
MKFSAVVLALCLTASTAFAPQGSFMGRSRTSMMAAPAATKFTSLPATVKPGVVTGKALNDLLQYAQDKGFAIPGVNIVGTFQILMHM